MRTTDEKKGQAQWKKMEQLLLTKGTAKEAPICNYCKKPNHIEKFCRIKKVDKKRERKSSEDEKSDDESDRKALLLSLCEVNEKASTTWIIDSGRKRHICNDNNKFTSFTRLEKEIEFELPNGTITCAKSEGTCIIQTLDERGNPMNLTISKVLYVPEIEYNLLSVRELTTNGYNVHFQLNNCKIKFKKRTFAIGFIKNNLYQIQEKSQTGENQSNSTCSRKTSGIEFEGKESDESDEESYYDASDEINSSDSEFEYLTMTSSEILL